MSFQVDQIDHVELTVADRFQAAEWYENTLGLRIVPEFEFWADDPRGPLMIGTPEGNTKLALFEGTPTGSKRNTGFHLVAFRVGASSFVKFVELLPEFELVNQHEEAVTRSMVTDHTRAYSIYFCDPYGNQLELTTYDHQTTKTLLNLD